MIREAISTVAPDAPVFQQLRDKPAEAEFGLVSQRTIGILDAFRFERQLECRAGKASGELRLSHRLGLIGADFKQDHVAVLDLDDDGGMVFDRDCGLFCVRCTLLRQSVVFDARLFGWFGLVQ